MRSLPICPSIVARRLEPIWKAVTVGIGALIGMFTATGPPSPTATDGTASPDPTTEATIDRIDTGAEGTGHVLRLPPVPVGRANDGTWRRLIFRDEFDQGTAKWQRNWRMGDDVRISPPANRSYEAACWDPRNTFTSNGNLVLRAERRTCTDAFGRTYSYTTGGASSGTWNFTYGYAEARIYLPADSNGLIANFPAWWLNGTINDERDPGNDQGRWPEGGEIDIIEGLSEHRAAWHYHWSDNGTARSAGGTPSASLVPTLATQSGWHTYGVEWSPGVLRYYYDGILVATHTTGVVSTPMYLVINNAVPAQWTPTVPADMLVDYVRVWQR